ncbi:MAG: hypothetical protein HKN72_01395 [Gemmatimonadetes bacterium]|nr:hypothetical protein [Gemmatimonadota bacterium]
MNRSTAFGIRAIPGARLPILAFTLVVIGACASSSGAYAQQTTPCDIRGVYDVPSEQGPGATAEITSEGEVWVGTIIGPEMGPVGHRILTDLRYDADEARYEGTLNTPDGRSLSAEVECVSDEEIQITGKRMMMSRSFRWRRQATEGAVPSPAAATSQVGIGRLP